MDPRHTKSLKINQEEKLCYLQEKQIKNDNTNNGRATRGVVGYFNSLYKYWSGLICLISHNGTKIVGGEQEFAKYDVTWKKERFKEHLNQRGIR